MFQTFNDWNESPKGQILFDIENQQGFHIPVGSPSPLFLKAVALGS